MGFLFAQLHASFGESQLNRSLAPGCNCDYNSRVNARILLLVTFTAVLLMSSSQPAVSNSAASGDGLCRPQIDAHGPAPNNGIVMNGIDVLEQDGFREVLGSGPSSPRAVGVITNHTGFDVEGRRTIDILAKAPGIKLVAIFSPEHGVTGELEVNSVGDSVDRATGVHIYSIYGDTTASRHPPESVLRKLDVLVIDIQDIGSRFYTYESTLGYTLESAAITGTEVVVLDRPNPLTGVHVQGPVSDGKHLNFVDYTREPIRHGMTVGELAKNSSPIACQNPIARYYHRRSFSPVPFCLFFIRWISVGEGVCLPRPRTQVVHGTVPQQCARNSLPARSGILYRPAIEGLRCHPLPTSSARAPEVTPN